MTPPRAAFSELLSQRWRAADSLLCVGLDPDPQRFAPSLRGRQRAIEEFCCAVADATAPYVCAFKPQIAHFAAHRAEEQLEAVLAHLRARHPSVPVILDAKRGDIGSTAEHYAREAFERYGADAVTLSPFMGQDSIEPFLASAALFCCAVPATPAATICKCSMWVANGFLSASRASPRAHGTAGASSDWWLGRRIRKSWRGCVRWLRKCRCWCPESARKAAMSPQPGARGATPPAWGW
jgi:hypothetical protein